LLLVVAVVVSVTGLVVAVLVAIAPRSLVNLLVVVRLLNHPFLFLLLQLTP
jgi:hypothetical protein